MDQNFDGAGTGCCAARTYRHASGKPLHGWRCGTFSAGLVLACVMLAAAGCTAGARRDAREAAAASAAANAAESAAPLMPMQAASGQLQAWEARRWTVQAPAGAVVQGRLQALDLVLDVETPAGRHIRRLSSGLGVEQSFTWQTRGAQQERLVLRRSVGGLASTPYAQQLCEQEAGLQPCAQGESKAFGPGRYRLQIDSVRPAAAAPAAPGPAAQQPLLSPTLQALRAQLDRGQGSESFWKAMASRGTPLVEPWDGRHRLVTFLWRGARESVRLFGSPSGNHDLLQQLGGSDVWWASFVMPDDARLSYGLAPDVPHVQGPATEQRRAILATLQRDPLNPQAWGEADPQRGAADAFDGRSVLSLPRAPLQPWVAPRAAGQVAEGSCGTGELARYWVQSRALDNGRDVWVYRPAGWKRTPWLQRNLLVLFDAHTYLQQVPTPRIVENLMADGLLSATAIVLVANAGGNARAEELPPNPAFADFMGSTLMPWLQQRGMAAPAARTVLAGSSYGGLAASYVAMRHPGRFGNVLSLSGSYWWAPGQQPPNWLARQYAAGPRLPVRFYLDAGLYEGARGGQAGIRETSRELGDVLQSRGYAVIRREHSTGHDYVHWQGSLACGLLALLGDESARAGESVRAACPAEPLFAAR